MNKPKTRSIRWFQKTWVRVLLILAVIALGAWVKHRWFTPPPKPQVVTAAASIGDIEDAVLATGTLNAFKLVSVGAQATGEVKHLYVKLGERVSKGQLVAEIDAQTQENNLRTAQAALASAQAQLLSARAQLKQAELNVKRLQALVAIDAGTHADLEVAEATLAANQAMLSVDQAQIDQNRITADTARVNLAYTRVLAPMDGTVVAVVTEQGQTVNALQSAPTIIKLANVDTMTVKAQISEADVTRVKAGMPVYFSLLGDPDKRIEAKLRAVEPGPTTLATDTSATTSTAGSSSAVYYNGIFDVPNAEGKLRINMTAQTHIVLAEVKKVLTIPASALSDKPVGDRYEVKVLEQNKLATKKVRVGMNNRVTVQVLDGLEAGELVVVSEAPSAAQKPE